MKSEADLEAIELNLTQIHSMCGVAIGLAHRWVDEKGLSSRKAGRERVVKLVDLLPFLADRYANNNGEFTDRLNAARLEKLERENAVAAGELITTDAHEDEMFSLAQMTVRYLGGMPGRLAGEVAAITDPALARDLIAEDVRNVRNEIAGACGRKADEIEAACSEQEGNEE